MEQVIVLIVIVLLCSISISKKWRYWFLDRAMYHYSGVEFICRKLIPSKQEQKHLPTLPLWLVGIYVALFGLASQRFENRVDVIERKANVINTQLTPVIKEISIQTAIISGLEKLKDRPGLEGELTIETKKLEKLQEIKRTILRKIPAIQNYPCPVVPSIFKPHKTILSLFIHLVHKESVDELKALIQDSKKNLQNVELRIANLEGANLGGANLEGANLVGADLGVADLSLADLSLADLEGTDLEGANLGVANLRGANLRGANLEGANLVDADLTLADLNGAYLTGAIFGEPILREPIFGKPILLELILLELILLEPIFGEPILLELILLELILWKPKA